MMKLRGVSIALALGALAVAVAAAAEPAGEGDQVGHFRTRVSPHVAGVFVEGKYYGTAAMFGNQDRAIELEPGSYDVELRDPRYEILRAKVTIEAGKTSTLRQMMKPLQYETKGPFGELKIDDFGNAAVYLDGKYYGNAKELGAIGHSLLLRPGKYRLKIEPADGTMGREEEVDIRGDMTLAVGRQKMRSYEE